MTPAQTVVLHLFVLAVIFLLPSSILPWAIAILYVYGVYKRYFEEIEIAKLQAKAAEPKQSHSNWWEVLGVSEEASIEECRHLRKLLSTIYHPDGGKAPNVQAMHRINAAVEEREALEYVQ